MLTSPVQPQSQKGEDGPIGFEDIPPWNYDILNSTGNSMKNGVKSLALVPYKKGWAMWNKYRDRIRYIWHPDKQLWMPNK